MIIMTRDLVEAEKEALQKAGALLLFAAGSDKEIPLDLAMAISASWTAQKAQSWDDTVSANFWKAFDALCLLIKPATAETVLINSLTAESDKQPPPRWAPQWVIRRGQRPATLAKITARRYLWLLMTLLCTAAILGFLASTSNRLTKDINTDLATADDLSERLNNEANTLEAKVSRQQSFVSAGAGYTKDIADVVKDTEKLYASLDALLTESDILLKRLSFGLRGANFQPGTMEPPVNLQQVHATILTYYQVRRDIRAGVLRVSAAVEIFTSAILPIILGWMERAPTLSD